MVLTSYRLTHSPPSSCPERLTTLDASKPTSSKVRLSLSLDGKAELVTSDVSPPRPQRFLPAPASSTVNSRQPGGLKRSLSALPFGQSTGSASRRLPGMPRIPSGRSRDARTWEFCCDTEARDELTMQAENESSGSAVAAISLLRSTSSTSLKANANKRNSPITKSDMNPKGKKPKLGRAASSLARLQYTGKGVTHSPSGDSDKENWLPHEESGNSQRRAHGGQASQKRRRVLQEPSSNSLRSSGVNQQKSSHKSSTTEKSGILEDQENEKSPDPEVEKFMRGEVSPSKKGDLDCIQGLLSLSQGTWR
jgi:hypothetical protein